MIFRAQSKFTLPRSVFWAGLLVALAWPAAAAEPTAPPAWTEILASARLAADRLDAIYNEVVLRDGSVDLAVRQLGALAQDATRPAGVRANALLVSSHLQWRFGRLAPATEAVDRALAIEGSGARSFHKARLLEAANQLPAARQWYERALAELQDPDEQEEVRLRLIFLTTDTQNVEALVKLARTRDRDFRNRAAVALAILNRPAEAVSLFEVFGEGAPRQRQHLRVAQWALQAGLAGRAQEEAWQAVLGAALPRDVRYALSILVEAHELDESWDKLLGRLAGAPNLGPDVQSMRVTLLRRLRRYGEAIALVEGGQRSELSPEEHRRLLRLYAEAGRPDAMVAEFRRLIAAEPAEVGWTRSLSEYYLEQGQREPAAQVWRDFTARNTKPDIILDGARTMAQLGLDQLALAAADQCAASEPGSAAKVMWFRFEHFLRRGQAPKAEEVLRQLEADLPPDSPLRSDVADAYERLKNPQRAITVWEGLARALGSLGIEERMRLAWLYDTVGKRDEALTIWRALWESDVPPARRKMIEDRLLQLAAETGGLGDIAVALEQRLRQGTTAAKDSSLLIRIYTDVGDSASAIEVIQEYFGRREQTPAVEIASLREQARVYQSLNRYAAFATVTEKLLRLDAENRTEYLQSLIINTVEHGTRPERDKLPQRLEELRRASVSAGDEFEAGVLAMANLKDKAIDTYRRALARHPGNSDDYLLLADLLKQNRRGEEAFALLQYFAETATGDDAFIVAVDGILNLKPTTDSGVLRWAQRRVLERITRRDDKYYLYDLAAEIAEEAKDTPAYLAALENALVDAGPRRSSVLRELVSATEDKPERGTNAAPIDPRRNLSYSRRLVTLGEEMPPEVYLNLGRAFLRLENPDEALAAFNLAIDRTDRASLVEDAADRFETAGYSTQAATLYEKALTNDAESISVMTKLARMRSRDGADALASDLYLRSALKLALQQLVEIDGGVRRRPAQADENYTFLYRRYFSSLQSGVIANTASDSPQAGTVFAQIEKAFDEALQEVVRRAEGRPVKPLESYPRLNVLARLARLTGLHTGRYEFADTADLKLLRHFGGDARLVGELVNERLAWGRRDSAAKLRTAPGVAAKIQADFAARTDAVASLEPLTDLAAATRQALAEQNFPLAADTASAAGDPALLASVYQAWLAYRPAPRSAGAALAAATPSVAGGAGFIAISGGVVQLSGATMAAASATGPNFAQIAAHARRRLDAAQFAPLARQIADLIVANPEAARDVLLNSASSALELARGTGPAEKSPLLGIEEAAGRKLFTPEQLSAALAAIDQRRLAMLDLDYVMPALAPAARVALLLRILQGMPAASINLTPLLRPLRFVLEQPIDAAAAARIAAAIKSRFDQAAKSQFGLRMFSSQITSGRAAAPVKVHPANAAFLDELDRALSESYADAFRARSFRAIVAPEAAAAARPLSELVEGAFKEYAQVDPSYPSTYLPYQLRQYLMANADAIYPARKAELLALLDRKAAESGLSTAILWTALGVLQCDPTPNPREQVAWLEAAAQRFPEHRLVLQVLNPLYRQLGEVEKERGVLERLLAVAPDNEATRQRLAAIWRNYDHPENALQALGGRSRRGAAAGDESLGSWMFSRFPQIGTYTAQVAQPSSDQAGANALRSLLQLGARQADYFQMVQSGMPAVPLSAIVDLTVPAKREADTTARWFRLLESDEPRAALAGAPRLLEQAVARPYARREFETILRTIDPAALESEDAYVFHDLLGEAIERAGESESELRRLTAQVAAGTAGKHELLVWLGLAARQPRERVAGFVPQAEKALAASGSISDFQRVLLARLYARAGLADRATGIYAVAATAAMASGTMRYSMTDRSPLMSAIALWGEAERHLERDGLGLLAARFAQIAKPTGVPALEPIYRRFVLWMAERTLDAGVAPDRLPAVSDPEAPGVRREELIRFTRLQSRLLPAEQALPALRRALRANASAPVSALQVDQNASRYWTSLGYPRSQLFESSVRVDGDPVASQFRSLFPASPAAWPGAVAWVDRAAQAIPEWIARGEVDRDTALQVLALVGWRQQQLGATGASATVRTVLRLLAEPDRTSPATARLAIAVAERTNVPPELALLKRLVESRALDVRQIAEVVRRAADREGVPAAVTLGETALQYTREDGLLAALEALAQRTGDDERRQRFAQLRAQAAGARASLEAPGRKSPGPAI